MDAEYGFQLAGLVWGGGVFDICVHLVNMYLCKPSMRSSMKVPSS